MLTTPPEHLPAHETPVLFGTRTLPEANPQPEPIAAPPPDPADRCGCTGPLALPPGWSRDDSSRESSQDLAGPQSEEIESDRWAPPTGAPIAALPDRSDADPPRRKDVADRSAAGAADSPVAAPSDRFCADSPPPQAALKWPAVDESPGTAVSSSDAPTTALPEHTGSASPSDRAAVDTLESSAIALSIRSDCLSVEPFRRTPSAPTTPGQPRPSAVVPRLPILIPLACLGARLVIEAATRTAMLAPMALRTIRSRGPLAPRRPYGRPPW